MNYHELSFDCLFSPPSEGLGEAAERLVIYLLLEGCF